MRAKFAAILFAMAAALPAKALAQGAWPEGCKLTRMAALPMQLGEGGLPLIPVQLDGKDVRMGVDTGGFATSLTRDTVADLGLVTHRMDSVIIHDVGGKIADEYVRLKDFKLDHLERGGIDLSVMESMGGAAGGLIAPDLLRNYDVEFDFGQGQFSLFRPHPCDGRAVYWTGDYTVLPISTVNQGTVVSSGVNQSSVMNDGHIRVPVILDGKETYAVIDTGASTSAISMAEAARLFGLSATSPDMKEAGHFRGGSGGEVTAYSFPFKTLVMGGVSVANPQIRIGEGRNFLETDFASLLLGMDVLRQLHLYIAYREGKLYVSSAEARP